MAVFKNKKVQQVVVSKAGQAWNKIDRSVSGIGEGRVKNKSDFNAVRREAFREDETLVQKTMDYIFNPEITENPLGELNGEYQKEEDRLTDNLIKLLGKTKPASVDV